MPGKGMVFPIGSMESSEFEQGGHERSRKVLMVMVYRIDRPNVSGSCYSSKN